MRTPLNAPPAVESLGEQGSQSLKRWRGAMVVVVIGFGWAAGGGGYLFRWSVQRVLLWVKVNEYQNVH